MALVDLCASRLHCPNNWDASPKTLELPPTYLAAKFRRAGETPALRRGAGWGFNLIGKIPHYRTVVLQVLNDINGSKSPCIRYSFTSSLGATHQYTKNLYPATPRLTRTARQ